MQQFLEASVFLHMQSHTAPNFQKLVLTKLFLARQGLYSQGKSGGKGEFEKSQGKLGKKRELFPWSGEICVFQIDFIAFKSGAEASGWNLKKLLKLCFHLLKDTLARRDDFISITEWTKFPLQFCATRFLELFIF